MNNGCDQIKEIYIYGCSDDLIEIDGDYNDELSAIGNGRISIRDYITVDVEYDDGGDWKITIIEDKSPHDWLVKKIGCNDEFLIIKYPDDVKMSIKSINDKGED